jgi:hypothetical protein
MLSAVTTYIKTCLDLADGAPVWVDFLGSDGVQYSVVPLPGARIISEDIIGNTVREFPFAFQSMASTADDLERLETAGFFETFAAWLESQSKSGVFPTLEEGQEPTKIESTGWGFLYEQGVSDTGIYQIQCKLTYEQGA